MKFVYDEMRLITDGCFCDDCCCWILKYRVPSLWLPRDLRPDRNFTMQVTFFLAPWSNEPIDYYDPSAIRLGSHELHTRVWTNSSIVLCEAVAYHTA
jgi:hypothetical protein